MSTDLIFWSPTLGLGALDYDAGTCSFTPKSGASPLSFEWVESRTGQASQKAIPRRKAEKAEWFNWLTFTTWAGEVFSFRRGGAP